MRLNRIFFLAVLLTASGPSLQAAPMLGVDVSTFPGITPPFVSYTAGYSFSLNQPTTLTSLGVWDSWGDGLAEAHDVGVWDSLGVLQQAVTVPSGTGGTLVPSADGANGWRFVSIADLPLAAGIYVIGATYSSTNTDAVAVQVPSGDVIVATDVSWGSARYVPMSLLFFPNLPSPTNDSGFFGPNFQVVPEPSSLALVAIAILGAGVWIGRWKQAFRRLERAPIPWSGSHTV